MRIAIDARAASHPQPGGYKSYTRQLIQHLTRLDRETRWLLYIDREMDATLVGNAPNVTLRIVPARLQIIGAGWREQVALPRALRRDRAAVAHYPTNTASLHAPCPTVVTLHDTLMWDEPVSLAGLSPGEKVKRASMTLYNRYVTRQAARHANAVITDSENSRRDLSQRLALDPARIRVIYPAPASTFYPVERDTRAAVLAKYDLREPYILALSSASPRKNAFGLLQAFARLEDDLRSSHRLALVWTHGLWRDQISRQIDALSLRERTTFIEKVSDEELAALYSGARAFVFPSLYEGFGLPPLEAMSCGAPVVASNQSSLPEILGDAALLVNPADTSDLAAGITQVLRSTELSRQLRARGTDWVRRYSWERCARETLQVYEKVHGETRHG